MLLISYQQNSRVVYTFVPNKSFVQLLDISPENLIFLKTFVSEFLYVEVSFPDQNSNPLMGSCLLLKIWAEIMVNIKVKS